MPLHWFHRPDWLQQQRGEASYTAQSGTVKLMICTPLATTLLPVWELEFKFPKFGQVDKSPHSEQPSDS